MIEIEPQLSAFDAVSLTVALSCWDTAGIKRVEVKDRFGLVVAEVSRLEPAPYVEIAVDRLSRRRFPLFVEGTSTNGMTPLTTIGPVFASPTDEEHKGGVALPRGAVDSDIDPVIWKLKHTAARAAGQHAVHRQQASSLEDLARPQRKKLDDALAWSRTFTVALLVLASLDRPRWEPIVAACAFAAIGLVQAFLALRRLRSVNRKMRAQAEKITRERKAYEAASSQLFAFGVPIEGLGAGGPKTGCGCSR